MPYLTALLFVFFFKHMSTTEYECNRTAPCGCSRQHIPTSNSWDWAVSLRDENGHFCGGSILNEQYVVTAAHCFLRRMHRLLSITVCAGTCRQRRTIKKIINHPSFNRTTFENDIALIQVKVPFNFKDKSIAWICLPDTNHTSEYPKLETVVIAIGWNRAKASRRSKTLQQVTVRMLNKYKDSCYIWFWYNHHLQLCAGAPGKDTCQGDSGGPLMVFTDLKRWELIGITSYGESTPCTSEYPGVYTRVTAFLPWIQQFINPVTACID